MATGIEEVLQQQENGIDEATPETTENENVESEKVEEEVREQEETVPEEVEEKQDEVPAEEPPAIPPNVDELNELRQFIREQRKEIAAMKAKLSRIGQKEEVDDEGNVVVSYTPLEKLQMELHNVAVSRAPILEVLVEAMEANPKYADLRDVCTKAHFDDIFEMAASTISRNEKRDFNEVLLQLELEVWQKANPYKYMYSIIKENHPKFKGKEVVKPEVVKKEETVKEAIPAKKVLEAKAAPGSIAAAGAGENLGTGAWTAAKIDDLPENELHQVPKEIYQKYMMGKLK